ncbi:MAG: WD40 repeat domain-containing protein [Bauldia sp.]|nr:WD40 repeat domain-containing protein [Bauldia sp.]MCW5717755.1 WD40 repeat domain-containing protein [Bauldia sp.]
MPTVQRLSLDAFVVGAAFIEDVPAFALGDGSVRLMRDGAAESVPAHQGAVLTAIRSADGRTLLTGGDDGRLVSTSPAGVASELASRPKKWIDQIASHRDGAVAFAAGKDATVLLPKGGERVFAHQRTVGGLAFAPKGMRLAAARYDGVSLWWVNTETPPVQLEWKGAHIGVDFAPDGRFLVTVMQENALHGWKLPEGGGHLRMTGYGAKPRSLSWSVKGKYLATSGADAAILWPFFHKDGPQGKQPLQLGGRGELVVRVACHPKEELVAIGYRDGVVAIGPFDEGDGSIVRDASGTPVSALAWDDAGRRLAYGTEDGAAGVIDFT